MDVSSFWGIDWDFQSVTNLSWVLWGSGDKMLLLSEKMSERFSPGSSISSQLFQFAVLLIILAAAVATVCFLSKIFNLTKQNSLKSDYRSVYQKLCSVHRLTLMERLLIRKMIKTLEIIDPLLVFVEPKYFHSALTRSDFKANRTMLLHLINKLFGFVSDKESFSHELGQQSHVEDSTAKTPEIDFPEIIFQDPVSQENPFSQDIEQIGNPDENQDEKPSIAISATLERKKVLHPLIPGSQAFSSLASTIQEVRSEIASKSLQNHLLSGRENNRTFKVHHFANSPTAGEVCSENQRSVRIEDAHPTPGTPKSRYGEVFTMEDVALLEAMITEKHGKIASSDE